MKKPSARTQLIVGILISLAFLIWVLKEVDFVDFKERMKQAQLGLTLPLLLLLLAVAYVVRSWRWALILRPVDRYSTWEVFPALMIGFMGNNIYPAHLGEFLRAYAFSKQKQIPFTTVFSTLVVERVLDLVAILSYFFAAIFLLESGALPAGVVKGAVVMSVVTGVAILVLVVFLVFTAPSLRLTRWFLGFLPEKFGEPLYSMVESGIEGLGVLRSPMLLIGSLVASFVHWLLFGLMVLVAVMAFGVRITIAQSLFLQGLTALAVIIPASPGFFGVVQKAFEVGLVPFGIDTATAFAASMYYHAVQYIPVTLVGLYFLRILGIDIKEAQEARAQVEGSETEEKSEESADSAERES